LIRVSSDELRMTGTDLEVELVSKVSLEGAVEGEATVPAKKLLDIVRSLPEGHDVKLESNGDKIILRSGRSKFTLSSLPASEFPDIDEWEAEVTFELARGELKHLMER